MQRRNILWPQDFGYLGVQEGKIVAVFYKHILDVNIYTVKAVSFYEIYKVQRKGISVSGSETKVLQRFWQEWFPGSVQQVVNHRHNFTLFLWAIATRLRTSWSVNSPNFSMVVGLAALILNMNNAVEESCLYCLQRM